MTAFCFISLVFHIPIDQAQYMFLEVLCSVTSVVSDSATPWTATYQVPLSKEFFRQENWSGLPFPSLGCHILNLISKCVPTMLSPGLNMENN